LLVKVEGSLQKRWVALYALASVWRREREKQMCTLISPHRAWRGEVMGV
jgi:hypothetical protein